MRVSGTCTYFFGEEMSYLCLYVVLFQCVRLEENPHQIMFGEGPEIAIFETIAPYVSFNQCCCEIIILATI